MKYKINNVFTGKVKKEYDMVTAIGKDGVDGDIYLSTTGLDNDECAEEKFHGGLERALHQYPSEHYQYWQEKYGVEPNWQAPGMGENISAVGMTEKNVFIGERFRWGEAIIEVSQPRSPCFKVNKRWGVDDISLAMQTTCQCGWLYRVIQSGKVNSNDSLISMGTEPDSMSVHDVLAIFFGDPLNQEGLQQIVDNYLLADEWRAPAKKRLQTNQIEPWQSRLFGRAAKS